MADNAWKETTGVGDDKTRVTIIPTEEDAETWDEEAEEHGYRSRSQYLYELIQEARAYRQEGFLAHHQSEEKIEELEAKVNALENELSEEQKQEAGNLMVDDPRFVKEFLTTNYQPLKSILQDIIESGALDGVVRKQVENQLYVLAAQDQVEFERGWGWKLKQGEH